MVSGLSLKQKRFCEEYIKTGKAGQAARLAGYAQNSCDNPFLLFKSKKVQDYLEELNNKIIRDDIADIQECLKLVTDVMRNPQSTIEQKLKACDMRLKTLGAYIEKVQASVDTEICVNIIED